MIFSQAAATRLRSEKNKKRRSTNARTARPATSSGPQRANNRSVTTILRRAFGSRGTRTNRELYAMLRNRGIKHRDILNYAKNVGSPMKKSAYEGYKSK